MELAEPAPRMGALDAVEGWPVGEAAVAVVTLDAPGGGGAAAPTLTGVTGPMARLFAWASVTKPATALAVLIACEEGTLSLDDPAGPPGSTVRHLLAHASGLGPEAGPPVARPGRSRIYSNAGYELLGELLASRSQMSFADYLGEGVLGPLGMTGTVMADPADPGVRIDAGAAAAGLVGPIADLVRLGCELALPTLVSATTNATATSVAFPGLSGVVPGFGRFDPCDWGLGVEIRDGKHPHWTGTANSPSTFGHFGRAGSFLWVDPAAGVMCCALCDRPFGLWATRAWPQLADARPRRACRTTAGPGSWGAGGSILARLRPCHRCPSM